jgi:type IV secretion system protein TrbJ
VGIREAMNKKLLLITSIMLLTALPVRSPATLPVVDYTAIEQAIQQTLKQVQQYALQIEAYNTQLMQWKNELVQATGLAPALQIWQSAQQTMSSVMGAVNIFKSGNLTSTLSQFQNYNYWLTPPPGASYNPGAGSALQKQANDALFQGLAKQSAQIQADAANLQRLQSTAGSAQGQLQAITAASQLSGLMNAQLLQIRSLLVAEQQALAARQATLSNNEAMGAANAQNLLNANPSVSQPHTGWSPIQ